MGNHSKLTFPSKHGAAAVLWIFILSVIRKDRKLPYAMNYA